MTRTSRDLIKEKYHSELSDELSARDKTIAALSDQVTNSLTHSPTLVTLSQIR